MGKKHRWEYSNAANCQIGLMVCTACYQPIGSGEFRYRETADVYLPQHRACSADDPHWAVLDERQRAAIEAEDRVRSDILAVMEKHSISPGQLIAWAEEISEAADTARSV